MRGRMLLAILAASMLALTGCGTGSVPPQSATVPPGAAGTDVWLYAVSAGKADALLVGVGDAVCLIDAGYGRSMGKIRAAMTRMGVEKLDAVFVTHTDDDHVEGLEWLARSDFPVDAWYASAMFIDVKESKHPAVKAAEERGQSVRWLRAGDKVALGSGTIEVLAPSVLHTDKDDNNSLVLMVRTGEGSMLLAGDIELPAESLLLAGGSDLKCDVLKVANHADDDTTSEAFAREASPQVAVICTDSGEKPGTPDARVMALLRTVGAQVAVTQECTGGVLVRLAAGKAYTEYVNLSEPDAGVSIRNVDADGDTVTVINGGEAERSLAGWYIVSDRGGEMYLFPDDAALAPGGTLIVGTQSSEGAYDLLWDDKKVIHKSKNDVLTLYNADGMAVSAQSNGIE